MARVVVVGSGASGVHFALTALEKGHDVIMVDVGYQRPAGVLPGASFDQLKEQLEDPAAYFLGREGQGVVYPATKASYYGHPPSKTYVFATPAGFAHRARMMEPLFSFARGGFAEAWTAGSYAFNDAELADFPFGYAELKPYYAEVVRRIGIGAPHDDLERFIPVDAEYLEPLPLDPHSALLVRRYTERRERLHREHRFYLGRSRVATLSRDYRGRTRCDQLGRCLWGCPTDSIYSPSVTLRECLAHDRFTYLPGLLARRFDYDATGRISRLMAEPIHGGTMQEVTGDRFVLAAGALSSSKLFLDSIHAATGRLEHLPGLMDNRQVHVPFLTFGLIGQPVSMASYQFHHLAFGIPQDDPRHYIHGQITTLKSASVHPIVQSMPLDLRTATDFFRAIRTGLGIANVNLHDTRRTESYLTLHPVEGGRTQLVVHYTDDPAEAGFARAAVQVVTKALGKLGCLVPPGMTRVLPKGASVHYTGTLPMRREPAPLATSPSGQSYDFSNLWVVDGAVFPFLPAKNLTFTLMANAIRVADQAF